jgi:VPDSG-CTERM motif
MRMKSAVLGTLLADQWVIIQTMKRFTSLTKLVALAAMTVGCASLSFGGSYTLTMTATANVGGYWANPDAALGSAVLGNYASVTKSDLGFWTMCVETNEYFWSGCRYNAGITGTTAYGGGTNVPGTGDPISVGTAYLYEQFALGNLTSLLAGNGGFTYDVGGAARVQKTIWWLEGETGEGTLIPDAALMTLLSSANLGDITADYAGSDVKVMNLTRYDGPLGGGDGQTAYGTLRQDQLVLWQVPDGGSTVALLGAALLAIAAFRRRLF